MIRRLLTGGAFLAVGAVAAIGPSEPADARISVLYEPNSGHLLHTSGGRNGEPGLSASDEVLQQQPSRRYLPGSRQAWKISGASGSRATPSILGRGPGGMAKLLRDRVRRSGAHVVFLDELGSKFRGTQGDHLGAAMADVADEESIVSGQSVARRVHIYVPNVSLLMAQPDAWAGSWDALVNAGGVWIEAYRRSAPWTAEQWLTWPGAFRREFVARGGDPERLHLLITGEDQAEQWGFARQGDACGILANGPGAYQTRDRAPDFVSEFRATFGTGPAPVGPSQIACDPAPRVEPEKALRLSKVFAAGNAGAELPLGALGSPRLFVGIKNPLRVRLGEDPLGLAAALGVDARDFWGGARAVVRADGDGWRAQARLDENGTANLSVLPTSAGPVTLRLIVRGSKVNQALGGPVDHVTSFEPFQDAMPAVYRRMKLSPRSWRFVSTLSLNGRDGGTPAAFAFEAPPPENIQSFRMTLAGPARTRDLGRAGKRWRLVLAQATDAEGVPVPAAAIRVTRTDGGRRLVRTDIRGRARILTPKRQGAVRAEVIGTERAAELRVAGPK